MLQCVAASTAMDLTGRLLPYTPGVSQCFAPCCSMLQSTAVCCSVLQCVAASEAIDLIGKLLQYTPGVRSDAHPITYVFTICLDNHVTT